MGDLMQSMPKDLGAAAANNADTGRMSAVLRLNSAGLTEVLERLGDPAALGAGQVIVVGLDGIAERFGARWGFRRELVYQHVERVFQRRLGEDAVFQRTDEMHYIVVLSGHPRLQAQTLCLRCLREILHHFLGEVRFGDLRLHEVAKVTANEIVGHSVEIGPAGLPENPPEPAGEIDVQPAPPRPVAAPPQPSPPPLVARWSPFVASNGKSVRVSCVLEPVINLAASTRIGFRLARRVLDLGSDQILTGAELKKLSRADIARVDCATIARGLDRLHSEAGGDKLPTLIVPVAFATLSNQRTREAVVSLFEEAKSEVRHGLVCEICDLDGVPPGSLLTTMSLIRPYCLRILGFVGDPRSGALQPLRGLGLDGVSTDCPPHLGDTGFVGWVREVRRLALPVAGALFLYRAPSIQHGALASLAGATHVSLAASAKPGVRA